MESGGHVGSLNVKCMLTTSIQALKVIEWIPKLKIGISTIFKECGKYWCIKLYRISVTQKRAILHCNVIYGIPTIFVGSLEFQFVSIESLESS